LNESLVIPGLLPGIHACKTLETWMAGTSPARTSET
jgi:hypothetical protein